MKENNEGLNWKKTKKIANKRTMTKLDKKQNKMLRDEIEKKST
jgi:hypothetical protein